MSKHEVLTKAAQRVRELSAQVASLTEELASYKKQETAEKIASTLQKKGLLDSAEIRTKAQEWVEQGQDLLVLEKAAEISRPLAEGTFSGTAVSRDGGLSPEDRLVSGLIKLGAS